MKIKLTSFYGSLQPGDIADVDDAEGARLIEVGGAIAYMQSEAKSSSNKALKSSTENK